MLTNTFCHIPGIGAKTERDLWAAGITSWGGPLPPACSGRSFPVRKSWLPHLQDSAHHYANRDVRYFYERLPSHCLWRLFADFRDSCAFLDIETTGLSGWDHITTIALYDGRRIRHYINGLNLDEFLQDVQAYRLLVTYNGKTFDVPFIERFFQTRLVQAHIDLRYTLQGLGITGGLKACERQMGVARPGLEEIDGFMGVLLWQEYRGNKDRKALETLLAYNIADTVNLEALMVKAYNAMVQRTPFAGSHSLPLPPVPVSPCTADRETVDRVLRSIGRQGW